MEGNAWSVSEKYILACDSMTLLINPIYYDFFARSLIPMKHYWPVNPKNLCKSIKFAVDWGNNNTHKVNSDLASLTIIRLILYSKLMVKVQSIICIKLFR